MAKRNFIPLVPSGTINADASVAQLEQDVLAVDAKVGELAEDIGDTEQEINQLKSHISNLNELALSASDINFAQVSGTEMNNSACGGDVGSSVSINTTSSWKCTAYDVAEGEKYLVTTAIYGSTYYGIYFVDGSNLVLSRYLYKGSNTSEIINDYYIVVPTNAVKMYVNRRSATTYPSAKKEVYTAEDIAELKSQIDDLQADFEMASPWVVPDIESLSLSPFTINSSNKWVSAGTASTRGTCLAIPGKAKKVRVAFAENGGVIAFLKTYDSFSSGGNPDFSTYYPQRIGIASGTDEIYEIKSDMKYLYLAAVSSTGGNLLPSKVVFETDVELYSPDLYPYAISDFEAGGIDDTTGANTAASTRARTTNYHKICHNYIYFEDAKIRVLVAYYDKNYAFIGMSTWVREATIKETDMAGAVYFRLLFSYYRPTVDFEVSDLSTLQKVAVTDVPVVPLVADKNISNGDYFLLGDTLFLATADIASGAAITIGTNATVTDIATALNSMNT